MPSPKQPTLPVMIPVADAEAHASALNTDSPEFKKTLPREPFKKAGTKPPHKRPDKPLDLDQERELAYLRMGMARMALRAGYTVLRYKLRPGEQVADKGGPWILTINTPEGQICFGFSERDAHLLEGVPKAGAVPVSHKDLGVEELRRLTLGLLSVWPEEVPSTEVMRWTGADCSDSAQKRILENL